MPTQTPVMQLKVGDKLALDSGNYIVNIEHLALVRGTELEIKYRAGRSASLHTLTVSKFATIPTI